MNIERYQTYKDSEVKWLGDIPEHWETCVVKRVAKVGHKNFVDGDWIESPYITDKGIRLIQTGNVGIGIYKEKGGRYISEKTFKDLNCTEIFPDDVLICRLDGPVGRACLVPDLQARMITSVDNTILKPSKDFDSKFIVYVMSSSLWLEWTQALCRVGGGFRFRISRSMLGELRIQKPPLSEQEVIAHYLGTKTTQIDRKIDSLTQKAALYGALKQSLIHETVTRGLDKSVPMKDSGIEWIGEIPKHWEVKRVKDIFLESKNKVGRESFLYKVLSLTIKGVIIRDLENNKGKIPASFDGYQVVQEDNIVFCLFDMDVTPRIVGYVEQEGIITSAYTIVKKRMALNMKYYYYFFLEQNRNKSLLSVSKTLRSTLTFDFFGLIAVPFPPIPEQKAIADYLDTKTAQIDQIIQTINTQIEKLKELRKTLINDVVTGKIKVV